jgi:proliferating cell nuclear antigen
MLELRLVQAASLKNVLEALSVLDLSSEVNFEFSGTGFELQAMDTSGAALVALLLRADAFNHYLCDRDLSMGLNLADMANVFRCANNDDILTIKVDGCPDTVMFVFESPSKCGTHTSFALDALCPDPVLILGLWK